MGDFNRNAERQAALRRREHPKVTRADLDRVAAFLHAMGAKVAAVNVMPGQTKIVTTDGQGIKLGTDEDELDRELEEYRQQRGNGPT